MAGKKGKVDNQSFLNGLTATSRGAAQNVSRALEKAGSGTLWDDDGRKKIEYIDISKMEGAPAEWNRYPLLKDNQPDKYLELKLSIYEKGVETPLVLWKQPGGVYMILAGHNRRDICAEIITDCREEEGFDEEKYRMIPCIVYQEDELDETKAREIIDDTNLYRDFSKLPEKIKQQIVVNRLAIYKRRHYAKGERIDQLMKDFGLKKSAIYDAIALNENVIEPLQKLFFDGVLKKKSVMRFAFFPKDTQQWMYDEYAEQISDAKVNVLKKNMTRDEIAQVFRSEGKEVKRVTVEIPAGREEEFRVMLKKWLAEERQA
jgi:ParB-like chromosome segregation protein Spo0J